jgi:hypothetical protein
LDEVEDFKTFKNKMTISQLEKEKSRIWNSGKTLRAEINKHRFKTRGALVMLSYEEIAILNNSLVSNLALEYIINIQKPIDLINEIIKNYRSNTKINDRRKKQINVSLYFG